VKAYEFEVYADRLCLIGVCSNAPPEEIVRWRNATHSRRWKLAPELKFREPFLGYEEGVLDGKPFKRPTWGPPEDQPGECPDKPETHKHYMLRSY
jgi:hypothetical protein